MSNSKEAAKVVRSFNAGLPHRKLANTHTDGRRLTLHGNLIAEWINYPDFLRITTAGWDTATTRDRLNHITGVGVTVSRGQLRLRQSDGTWEAWDGSWKEVRTNV